MFESLVSDVSCNFQNIICSLLLRQNISTMAPKKRSPKSRHRSSTKKRKAKTSSKKISSCKKSCSKSKTYSKRKKVKKSSTKQKKSLKFDSSDGITSTEKRREMQMMEAAGGYRVLRLKLTRAPFDLMWKGEKKIEVRTRNSYIDSRLFDEILKFDEKFNEIRF